MANIYTVAKINSYIKGLFNEDFLLRDVSVKGEVSNLKYHSAGHIYFTLKDEKSAISCVCFKGNRAGLSFVMSEGMQVVVRGNIDVYERDGKYQIYAKKITRDGEGALFEEFQRLKEELEQQGMFAPEYKREIPRYARKVGIVTASTGAAVQDIINISKRRNPYVQLVLYPATVQGEHAKNSIIKGIETLDEYGVDVMIVGRGGGSIEDLWAFNEREVAEAVFNCQTPVISAVGHETDTTIIDFVADLRAPTPSAAAELAVFDYFAFENELDGLRDMLKKNLRYRITKTRSELLKLEGRLKRFNPANSVKQNRMYLVKLEDELRSLMDRRIKEDRHNIGILAERLNGLSPLLKLSQGYSYVSNKSGTLNSVNKTKVNDELSIYVKDGIVDSVVTGIRPGPIGE
ncbi:MAG: exodeoxyribonuclease VII large subunit [Lachnospiraceae bacterium]|nr:exodeoxyribonuclease VII large subunit [Lachnospiraceae bacterium]